MATMTALVNQGVKRMKLPGWPPAQYVERDKARDGRWTWMRIVAPGKTQLIFAYMGDEISDQWVSIDAEEAATITVDEMVEETDDAPA